MLLALMFGKILTSRSETLTKYQQLDLELEST